ncbi:hypothetical protein [Photorhabdus africana]|uniref:hypothetical protein n=1 Tax=Photorhabdus africana TaxID=3097554 RepID=UPI002B40217A|nr:hypothetical protein [Photorhabdus sp. CRI-LC]
METAILMLNAPASSNNRTYRKQGSALFHPFLLPGGTSTPTSLKSHYYQQYYRHYREKFCYLYRNPKLE